MNAAKETFRSATLSNGLTLLGEPMDQVSSVAATFVLPAGVAYDPPGCEGAAAVAAEWCFRGAGDRDTRQLHDALDSIGCHHHESIRSRHLVFSTAHLGRYLPEVLAIYADVIRRGRLEDESFEPCRALTQQDLASLEDEPAKKSGLLVRERFYPYPLGRCVQGTKESLENLSPQMVRDHLRRHMVPDSAIIAVAGNFDWNRLCDLTAELFGEDWTGKPLSPPPLQDAQGGLDHIRKESAQTHIALAHKSALISSDHYYAARVAETILSAGTSSRLFAEVREKRGLAYHVSSHYHSVKDHAGMFTYAGTTPAKAQETLDVTVGELRRLADGIESDELKIAKTQLNSALVMQGESTESRSAALASDWLHVGRLRSLHEISDGIQQTTIEDILSYLREYPARNFTLLTIGPEPLDLSSLTD